MTQLALIDVPRCPPPFGTIRERVARIKKRERIWTHYCANCEPAGRWMAMLLNQSYRACHEYCKGADIKHPNNVLGMELIAGACRLIEDYGLCAHAPTEREAIEDLCRDNKIVCELR